MAKKTVAFVIDADIARSSSLTPKPRPQNCQHFLRAVAENDHLLVMTPDLITEWNKHQSSFARKWRRKMYGRHKKKSETYKIRIPNPLPNPLNPLPKSVQSVPQIR